MNEIATPQQWHKWRHNAYRFGQGGCNKRIKITRKQKQSQKWHKWRHNAYRFGQVGYYERNEKLGNKLQPHNNGTSGGTMLTVLAKVGVKVKNKKANLIYYNIRFLM
jgi:hypothetical protein